LVTARRRSYLSKHGISIGGLPRVADFLEDVPTLYTLPSAFILGFKSASVAVTQLG
jgi:hypothetical protein